MIAVADEADARFESRQRARRDAAIAALPQELLVALAGAPFWTATALAAAGLDLQYCLSQGSALVRREGFDTDMTIALDADAVEDVIRAVYARGGREPAAALAALAEKIAWVDDHPPVLAQWARLAKSLAGGATTAANDLHKRVQELCDGGQLGEASELLEAAGPLARTVGGPLAVAERISRHRIEREFRGVRDRRQLSFFVGRDEAMTAFRRLLAEEGPWALHYVGVGGAGKTTFMRHLAVEQAAALGLSVAQIDFDYLSPAYPGRDPGRLVQALVHELTILVDRAEQDRWLQSIDEQLARLREVAQEVRAETPIGPIAWPEFQELLGFVASFLQSFPRPLIIFDTCEELMKLSPVGGTIPSVEATFRLIEELHQRVPQLRVIFAGRRLLAAGGDGWAATPPTLPQPLSAARPYLMLHELRGMTPDEASSALDRLLPESRRDDQRLRKAILDGCPEDGRVAGLVRPAGADGADGTQSAPRFSPFRVVRFGRWVAAEPTLSADRLEQGGDPYIEQRVVQRMGALEALLPMVVLLRRFDAKVLARVRGQSEEAARETIHDLAGAEWTYAHDDPGRGVVVEITPTLREQLERYLSSHRAEALAQARESIGGALGPVLNAPDAVLQPPELIDAALRAMPGVTAVRAWFVLEASIGQDWGSALTLTRFLLGEGNAGEDGASILGCAVRATHISALIHEHPELDVSAQWRQIAAAMSRLEQIATVRMLRCRARLGAITAQGWRGTADPDALCRELDEVMTDLGPRPRAFAATWVIAAVEGVIERLERGYVTCASLEQIAAFDWWAGLPLSPGLGAWVTILRARAAALLHQRPEPGDAILAAEVPDLGLPKTCLDWLPPASLRDRIRLEGVRLLYFQAWVEHESAAPVYQWRSALARWVGELEAKQVTEECTDDGDRLISAFLQYEAGIAGTVRPVACKVQRRGWGLREPAVYRRFAPSAVTLALLQWDAAAVPAELSAIDAVRVRLARARRTRDRALLPAEVTQSSSNRLFVETAQAAALVLERVEPVPAELAAPAAAIDHWSYQRAITNTELSSAVDGMRPHLETLAALVRGNDLLIALRARATLEEVNELARYTREPLAVVPRPPGWHSTHPDQLEAVARLQLQEAAAQEPLRMARSLEAIARVMPGMIARLAIEEAELLSLRFPERAARLFDHARETLARLGCKAEAQIAALGAAACRRMLGGPAAPATKIEPAVPALAGFAARVSGSGPPLPLLERARARRPSLRRLARAWARRYADELLLLLGLGFGALVATIGWLLLDRVILPALPIPQSRFATAVAFFLGAVLLLVLRAVNYRALRASALWRWLQVLRPWRYRLALGVLADREGLRVVVERRNDRQTWRAPRPGPGELPLLARSDKDRARLAALRDEIAQQSPLPVVARADIARAVSAAAWEAPLVAELPNLVIWRAVQRIPTATFQGRMTRGIDGTLPATPQAPTHVEAEIADAWLAGCGVSKIGAVRGIAHLVGRPRRLVGSIELERAHARDRAPVPGRMEHTVRRFDDLDVVLQLAPQDIDQASPGTRIELGLLRELAGSLIERGARSVLVVPAIANDRIEEVVLAVAQSLGRAPQRKLRRLVEAARQCRAAIGRIAFADHAIVANEVTLFVAVTGPTPE
ncbi:MAG TPA: hypothetical protein VNO30_34830 [Kofleriaceae bacterium]|nr:hypothetical protein [Kofleriaceae bacterium]